MVCRISHSTVLGVLGILYTGEAAPPDGAVLRVLRSFVRPIVFAPLCQSPTDWTRRTKPRPARLRLPPAPLTQHAVAHVRGCIGSAEPLDEDIDVIFIGVVSPRRKRIIDALIKCAATTTHPPTRLCAVSTATGFGTFRADGLRSSSGPSRILCVEYRVSQGFSVQSILWSSGWPL